MDVGFYLAILKPYPQHTFIFLTKQPQNLPRVFPDNCWVGVSVDNETRYREALNYLPNIKAGALFASFEPLLTRMPEEGLINFLDWAIIGQQTPERIDTMPKIGWVEDIIKTANRCRTPVFLKNNLISCVDQYEFALKDGKYRQEFPGVIR